MACFKRYNNLLGYVNDLMVKAAELCLDDHDKPDLPIAPSPLASNYKHPYKDTMPLFP